MAFSAGLSGEKRGDAPRATTGDATAWTTCGSARGGCRRRLGDTHKLEDRLKESGQAALPHEAVRRAKKTGWG